MTTPNLNPLHNKFILLFLCGAAATYVAPRLLVKFAPKLGGVINPATGRFALPSGSSDEEIAIARQAVIGTSAAVATLGFIGVGMLLGGKTVAAAAAGGA